MPNSIKPTVIEMKLLSHILTRLTVLAAESQPEGWRLTLLETVWHKKQVRIRSCKRDHRFGEGAKLAAKTPVALVLYGHGIISKIYPAESDLAARITGNAQEFISFSEPSGDKEIRLTFLRRELYDSLAEQLAGYGLPVVATRICAPQEWRQEVKAAGEEFFTRDLRIRSLMKPSPENSRIASLAASKLMLPVLCSALALLMANYFVYSRLESETEKQRYELGILRSDVAVRDREQTERRKLQEQYLRPSRWRYSFLADRIAGTVPDGVMLTALSMNPLLKKLQENKPLQADAGRIVIRGESLSSEPVAEFADRLRELEFAEQLKLISLDRDRTGQYVFEIEIRL